MVEHAVPTIEMSVAPAYECLLALSVFGDEQGPKHYDVGVTWFDRVRRQASPKLQAKVRRFTGGSDKIFVHLIGLAIGFPPPRDVSALLEQLVATDPLEIRLQLLGYYLRYFRRATTAETIRAAAAGDAVA